jgi:hypothetical protein
MLPMGHLLKTYIATANQAQIKTIPNMPMIFSLSAVNFFSY